MSPNNDAVNFGKPQSIEDIVNSDSDNQEVEDLGDKATAAVMSDVESKSAVGGGNPDRIVVDEPVLSTAKKAGFDPLAAQDARRDDRKEGGVVSTKRHSLTPDNNVSRYIPEIDGKNRRLVMSGEEKADGLSEDGLPEGGVVIQKSPHQDFSDQIDDGHALRPTSPNIQEKSRPKAVELSGFSVRYHTNTGHRTIPIMSFYNDVETAMATIGGMHYLTIVDNEPILTEIVSGKPIIIKNDRQLMEHVNGSWRRI